jgi:hypothetical protein
VRIIGITLCVAVLGFTLYGNILALLVLLNPSERRTWTREDSELLVWSVGLMLMALAALEFLP